jgi:hypothetical protein
MLLLLLHPASPHPLLLLPLHQQPLRCWAAAPVGGSVLSGTAAL